MRTSLPQPRPPDGRVKRSDPLTYLLCVPYLCLAVFGLNRTIHFHNPQLLFPVGMFLMIGLAFWIWVASFRLQTTETGIMFGQLFRPTRTILFQDILKASQRIGFENMANADGVNRLLIWHKHDPSEPYIVINLKVFRGEDVKNLLKTLKPWMRR
jgi:hypothetical protein